MQTIEHKRAAARQWRADEKFLYPEKGIARRKMTSAIRSGKMIRPNHCQLCWDECKPDGHHEDYYRPYDVLWLCRRCHFYAASRLKYLVINGVKLKVRIRVK